MRRLVRDCWKASPAGRAGGETRRKIDLIGAIQAKSVRTERDTCAGEAEICTTGNLIMKRLFFAIVLTAGYLAGAAVASAQLPALPGLPEPIPAPLPPPQQAPTVNGPATESLLPQSVPAPQQEPMANAPLMESVPLNAPPLGSQTTSAPALQSPSLPEPAMATPSPGVLAPPALNTFSDRTTQCLQLGGSFGLTGPNLQTYSSVCANEN
jgi:hypothetical protein